MTINTISTLPTAPARTDAPATFISRADAFLAALVTMQGELNTSIGQMNTDIGGIATNVTAAQAAQNAAETAETNAEAAQAAAEAASNATLWVSGTSYSAGDVVYSPVDYKSYRANTATSGTTDPSASADWTKLSYALPTQTGNAGKFLTTDGTDESWAEAGGGAWNLLNTYTASSDAQIEIDDFSSTYDDYVILLDQIAPDSDGAELRVRMELNGSFQTSNYSYTSVRADTSLIADMTTNQDFITLAYNMSSTPTSSNHGYGSFIVKIPNVNDAIKPSIYFSGRHLRTLSTYVTDGGGFHRTLNYSITSLRFYMSAGNISTGTFKIYGIAKA